MNSYPCAERVIVALQDSTHASKVTNEILTTELNKVKNLKIDMCFSVLGKPAHIVDIIPSSIAVFEPETTVIVKTSKNYMKTDFTVIDKTVSTDELGKNINSIKKYVDGITNSADCIRIVYCPFGYTTGEEASDNIYISSDLLYIIQGLFAGSEDANLIKCGESKISMLILGVQCQVSLFPWMNSASSQIISNGSAVPSCVDDDILFMYTESASLYASLVNAYRRVTVQRDSLPLYNSTDRKTLALRNSGHSSVYLQILNITLNEFMGHNSKRDFVSALSKIFTPMPTMISRGSINTYSVLAAVMFAPLLPFPYRVQFCNEDINWGRLRGTLSRFTVSGTGTDIKAPSSDKRLWISEGDIIAVTDDGKHMQRLDDNDVEKMCKTLCGHKQCYLTEYIGGSKGPLNSADELLQKYSEFSLFQVVSAITIDGLRRIENRNTNSDVEEAADLEEINSGYYVHGATILEHGDVSDAEGHSNAPMIQSQRSAHSMLYPSALLKSTEYIMSRIRDILQYQHAFEQMSLSNQTDALPPLSVVVVSGNPTNLPVETASAAAVLLGVPFTVFDCRRGGSNESGESGDLSKTLCELVQNGTKTLPSTSVSSTGSSKDASEMREKTPLKRPLILILSNAEIIANSQAVLHALSSEIKGTLGYLIILAVINESGKGSSDGAGPSSNASGDSGANGGSLSSVDRFEAALSTVLSGVTIKCGVPNTEERSAIIESTLLRFKNSISVSMTLSFSLLTEWTTGMSVMDIVTYLHLCVLRAFNRVKGRCGSSSDEIPFVPVLDDNLAYEVFNNYQRTHGLVVSSTKLQPVRWSDVGGLEEAKKEILETIQLPSKFPQLFTTGADGTPPLLRKKTGILLYGPPGCGKTLLAKAVATEMNMNFLSVKGPELINQYVGESERNIRDVFSRARDNAPCVTFWDELDALAPARGNKGDAGGAMDRIVSQLLVEMDKLSVEGVGGTRKDVFVIAATNRPDMLDPALLRPGRFDQRCYLGPPDTFEGKNFTLSALTRKFNLGKDTSISDIARQLQKRQEESGGKIRFTGADLFALCSDAMLLAVEDFIKAQKAAIEADKESGVKGNDSIEVSASHFQTSFEKLQPSVTPAEFAKYENLMTDLTQ